MRFRTTTPTSTRVLSGVVLASALLTAALAGLSAQIPGPNVNMVAGQGWPDGDPFLQRQNEPAIAVSTRNPLHLLAGANDYRTVDLPGLPDGKVTGDAWMGVFTSIDGGQTWKSTLLPGYPQDPAPSPLKAYGAAADPMVRAGSNGLFYYSGIVFNRSAPTSSALFVARYIDNNNKENGNPIAYTGVAVVASNPGTSFIDKPTLAVDIPRGAARGCRIESPAPGGGTMTQTFPGGGAYVAYSLATGDEDQPGFESHIYFTSSENCGTSWTTPVQISDPADKVNQGAAIAIDPKHGTVYVTWRRFSVDGASDAVMATKSSDFGRKFAKPGHVHRFKPGKKTKATDPRFKKPLLVSELAALDQPTFSDRFRTNAYPTMTVDGSGRVYAAWAERGYAPLALDPLSGDARVVLVSSSNGVAWTAPQPVDNPFTRGHQLMPSLTFSGGRLMVLYYDLRDDVSNAFLQFVNDFAGIPLRHTIDVRVAQAAPAAAPVFAPSVRVSQYVFGENPPGAQAQVQLEFNPPNLPLFRLGSVPFLGDYIDLAPVPSMKPSPGGGWTFNTATSAAPVFQAAWTDNRDVRPPINGNWTQYTPPVSPFHPGSGPSLFDASQTTPACTPGLAGTRNQNIYTARITAGLVVGAPGNDKPLSTDLQRAFVVFAQNATDVTKTFRVQILNQPLGGRASFLQLPLPPHTATSPAPLTSIDAQIGARSTIAREVYVTSTDPDARVEVSVVEIASVGGTPVASGLRETVVLNPDLSNPDLSNPDLSNPDLSNPDISNAEVYNPDLSNPDLSNPDLSNPDLSNPDLSNPDLSNVVVMNPSIINPDLSNPDLSNPDLSNPDLSNPDLSNVDLSNASLSDATWTITNKGNTTAAYSVKLILNQVSVPEGVRLQLILHRTYKTPVVDGTCFLKFQTRNVLLANITSPAFSTFADLASPQPANGAVTDASLWLAPGDSAKITLRVFDLDATDANTFDPITAVVPAVVAQSVNTDTALLGDTSPVYALPPSAAFPSARSTHAMVQMADGRFLMVGGHDVGTGGTGPLRTAETYDPVSDVFRPTADMTEKRFRPRAISLVTGPNAGKVLVIGGDSLFGDGGVLKSTEMFDPATGLFTLSAPANDMNVVRAEHEATLLLDGRILVTGGRQGQLLNGAAVATAEIYDPVTNTFTPTASPMAFPRKRHTATLLPSGKVLIAGGAPVGGGIGAQSTAEIYDPVADTFTTVPGGMVSARTGHKATRLLSGKVLVAGGNSAFVPIGGAEVYDPDANTFSTIPGGLGTPRANHSQTLLASGRVLILGGSGVYPADTATVELYDPAAGPLGSITTVAPLAAGRILHQSVLLTSGPNAGKVLLTGGSNGGEDIGRPPEFYLPPP